MKAPIDWLADQRYWKWLRSRWTLFACAVLIAASLPFAGLPSTPGAPTMLQLQLSGTSDGALAVVRALEDTKLTNTARRAIGVDFVLVIGYTMGVALILAWLRNRDPENADALVDYAGWGIVIAGALDITENIALWRTLSHSGSSIDAPLEASALIGATAALLKWTFLFAVLGYTAWELAKLVGRFFRPWSPPETKKAPAAPSALGTARVYNLDEEASLETQPPSSAYLSPADF